jgi:hypothetical protein
MMLVGTRGPANRREERTCIPLSGAVRSASGVSRRRRVARLDQTRLVGQHHGLHPIA